MISVDCPDTFAPHGKKFVDDVIGSNTLDLSGIDPASGVPRHLYHCQKFLKLKEDFFGGAFWKLEPVAHDVRSDSEILEGVPSKKLEEEFLWRRNVLAISRGIGSTKEFIKCQTENDTILDVFRVRFRDPLMGVGAEDSPLAESGEDLDCLCVVMYTQLSLYSKSGRKHEISLPFVLRQAWPTEFGLILERKILTRELADDGLQDANCSKSKQLLPIVFSLIHPHGEIVPVAVRPAELENVKRSLFPIEFVQDQDLRLVTCFKDYPLVVFYNASSRTHCVCWIRPFYNDEISDPFEDDEDDILFPHLASDGFDPFEFSQLTAPHAAPSFFEDVAEENARKMRALTLQGRPSAQQRRTGGPGIPPELPGPLPNVRDFQNTLNESSSVIRDPAVRRRSEYDPIKPHLCFVKIWEESGVKLVPTGRRSHLWQRGVCRKATKCFLSPDFSDVLWLCLLLPREQSALKLVEIIERSPTSVKGILDDEARVLPIACGDVVELSAVSACSLNNLSLLLVEAENGALVAYSGPMKIEKVLVNGQLSCFLTGTDQDLLAFLAGNDEDVRPQRPTAPVKDNPEERLDEVWRKCKTFERYQMQRSDRVEIPNKPAIFDPGFFKKFRPSGDRQRHNVVGFKRDDDDDFGTFPASKRRRGSSESAFDSAFDADGEESDWADPGNLVCAVNNSVILRREGDDGTVTFLRLEVPSLAECPMVRQCLEGLSYMLNCLDQPLFPTLAVRWYCARNSPGAPNESRSELERFLDSLLGLLGFPSLDRPDVESGVPKTGIEMRKTGRGKQFEAVTRFQDASKRPCWTAHDGKNSHKLALPAFAHDCLALKLFEMARKNHPGLVQILDDGNDVLQGAETEAAAKKIPVRSTAEARKSLNETAPLNAVLELVFMSIHLIYEELKLNSVNWVVLTSMTRFLATLCHRLEPSLRRRYFSYYWRDSPSVVAEVISRARESGLRSPQIAASGGSKFLRDHEPLSVFKRIGDFICQSRAQTHSSASGYPVMPGLTDSTEISLQVFGEMYRTEASAPTVVEASDSSIFCFTSSDNTPVGRFGDGVSCEIELGSKRDSGPANKTVAGEDGQKPAPSSRQFRHGACVMLFKSYGVDEAFFNRLPSGIRVPMLQALYLSAEVPPEGFFTFSDERKALVPLLELLGRHDLAYLNQERKSDALGLEPQPERRGRVPKLERLLRCSELCKTALGASKETKLLDGMDELDWEVLRLRFPKDQRAVEVRKYLNSSKAVPIRVAKRPDQNDHDYMEAQEKQLLQLCNRTMALPVGRGLFTLRSSSCVVTEQEIIPKLCLTGKSPPRNATVELTRIDVPPNMSQWPSFHNGAAAGLKLRMTSPSMASDWVVFNRPNPVLPAVGAQANPQAQTAANAAATAEHGGFLMAMGINGHLRHLERLNLHDYLVQAQEMITVGVLLGVGADFCGTQDQDALKLMSLHLEAMMVPTTMELDISLSVQNAAVVGLGLLYMGTRDGHICRVLLDEIGRPPGPEMDDSSDRESYCLSAGLALGMVCLGQGEKVLAADARGNTCDYRASRTLADSLYHFMTGGTKRPSTGVQKDKYKTPSYQIKEGDKINLDVTSPGATLAFGLMFFNTGHKTVMDWLALPPTPILLDYVRPDLVMLRVISRGLIGWDDIQPTDEWVKTQLPPYVPKSVYKTFGAASGKSVPVRDKSVEAKEDMASVSQDAGMEGDDETVEEAISASWDLQLLSQAYCNIVAGSCMVMAMRYAGSADPVAFKVIYRYAKMFYRIFARPAMALQNADMIHRSTIMNCVGVLALSLGVLMCGTGDLSSLRLLRAIHLKTSLCQTEASYGLHMAAHMGMGLLFLGGCSYSLKTTPKAVAAMVVALFPKFPANSNDNRYHLQALRHLIALAAEPRQLVPFLVPNLAAESVAGAPASAKIRVVCREDGALVGTGKKEGIVRLPGLLPELDVIKSIELVDDRFWKYSYVQGEPSWSLLKEVLEKRSGYMPLQPKQGALSYEEDPTGFRTNLAGLMTSRVGMTWSYQGRNLNMFTRLPGIGNIPRWLLYLGKHDENYDCDELAVQRCLMTLFYEFVTREKVTAFADFFSLFDTAKHLSGESVADRPCAQFAVSMKLWQVKLVHYFICFTENAGRGDDDSQLKDRASGPRRLDVGSLSGENCGLLNRAVGASFFLLAEREIDSWVLGSPELKPYIRRYFGWGDEYEEPEGISPEMVLEMSPETSQKLALFLEFSDFPLIPPLGMEGHPSTWDKEQWIKQGLLNERSIVKAEDLYSRLAFDYSM